MIFRKVIISNKNKLLEYRESIFNLFKDCFQQDIDEKLWAWAYIDNPNGSPVVSLYFDGEKLIGHYAVIPMNVVADGQEIKAALSMTTMVDLSYRKYGVFISQAEDVYQKAIELGYKLVYGFPNKKSAPGFRKRLRWILEEDLYVAKLNKKDLLILKKEEQGCIGFNFSNKDNFNWRMNKPSQQYIEHKNYILKKFGAEFDVVFSDDDFNDIDDNFEYNILLSSDSGDYIDKKQFDYTLGYRLFDDSLNTIGFKKDLIMSDVF